MLVWAPAGAIFHIVSRGVYCEDQVSILLPDDVLLVLGQNGAHIEAR